MKSRSQILILSGIALSSYLICICPASAQVSVTDPALTPLDRIYIFGDKLTEKNSGGFGRIDDLYKDPFIGDLTGTPKELGITVENFAAAAGSGSASAIRSAVISRAASDPSAAPGGLFGSGGSSAAIDTRAHHVGYNIAPNNPLDNLKITKNNQEIKDAATEQSQLSLAFYTLGAADPLTYDVLQASARLSAAFTNNVDQASMLIKDKQEEAGSVGEIQKMGTANCEMELTKNPGSDVNRNYPQLACQLSQTGAGTGVRSASLRASGADSPFVARDHAGAHATGSSAVPLESPSSSLASLPSGSFPTSLNPDLVAQALQQCGFSGLVDSVSTNAKCMSEAESADIGGRVVSAIRLSYLVFPEVGGAEASLQNAKRTQYQDSFGDKCYVCNLGGKDKLEVELPNNAIQLRKIDLKPGTAMADRFTSINRSIYENLRQLLMSKCVLENDPGNPQLEAHDVFHLKAGASSSKDEALAGEVKDNWLNGNFWKDPAVQGHDNTRPLPGGVMIANALDYFSFNGFRLTPAIVDAVYNIVTEKENITEASWLTGDFPDAGDLENEECTCRFSNNVTYDQVIEILKKPTGTASKKSLKREIKALFYLAQRITLGKVYDGCMQAMSKVHAVGMPPSITKDADESIAKICAGNTEDPTAFGKNMGDNIASLNMFVEKMFERIASETGKSGSSLAKAFKGDRNLATQGGLK